MSAPEVTGFGILLEHQDPHEYCHYTWSHKTTDHALAMKSLSAYQEVLNVLRTKGYHVFIRKAPDYWVDNSSSVLGPVTEVTTRFSVQVPSNTDVLP